MIATYRENIEALRSLGVVAASFEDSVDGLFLFLILIRKLDPITRGQFERGLQCSKQIPTPDQLIVFLERECQALEAVQEVGRWERSGTFRPERTKTTSLLGAEASAFDCVGCEKSEDHKLYNCNVFLKKTAAQRKALIVQNRLCFVCFEEHFAGTCSSKGRCSFCKGRHHSLIHVGRDYVNTNVQKPTQKSESVDGARDLENESDGSVNSLTGVFKTGTNVLLSTVVIGIQNSRGEYIPVRALLDCGSQTNYITSRCAKSLGLAVQKATTRIMGLAQNGVEQQGAVSLLIRNPYEESQMKIGALILEEITGQLPSAALPVWFRQQLGELQLADPSFDEPAQIDCLLGADVFARCLLDGRMELGPGQPVLINTMFGWVLMGSFGNAKEVMVQSFLAITEPLDKLLCKFWLTEEPAAVECKLAPGEQRCEDHFVATHSRSEDGRYIVRLPFRENGTVLGSSYEQAESRFLALERRLQGNPEMAQMYRAFMKDYEDQGHMEPYQITREESGSNRYYLPHHGVLKMSSSTTKLRVVFDASAKTVSNTRNSLNDVLWSGPKLQRDIMEVITQFRTHLVAFTADIRQMFRCVWVHPDDQRYQLILWRDAPEKKLTTYKLKTVTFGITSSPYLAMRSLLQLAKDEGQSFPLATRVLKNEVFVDDIVTGAPSVADALLLRGELVSLLGKAGFELRKWISNSKEFLESVPEASREVPLFYSSPDEPLFAVLGIGWQASSDDFRFSVKVREYPPTKRGVLSCISRFYDPLGFLAPVMLWAKILLQHLWVRGLGWDTMLPSDIMGKWVAFLGELPQLEGAVIPRYLSSREGELHGFSDASEKGFGAVVYFRPRESDQAIKPVLIVAKSRVAPLKQVSLPRLELCGAHLLAKLLKFSERALKGLIKLDGITAWSDSMTTLAWIRSPPHVLKTFVANRVSEIQDWVPPNCWRYVESAQNPADCASRGMYPGEITKLEMWFQGPGFLSCPSETWPVSPMPVNWEEIPERRVNPLQVLVSQERPKLVLEFLERVSSWSKLVRIVAYLLRFWNNAVCKKRGNARRSGVLSLTELRISTMAVLRAVQLECFESEIRALEQEKACSRRLQCLMPYVDGAGLIRVGGRIQNSLLDYCSKHPVILPSKHHVTNLLVDYYHLLYMHAGPRLLQSLLTRKYWIVSCRSVVRKRIHKCITCFKHRPTNSTPLMADLPPERVQPSRVFSSVALDYAGPFVTRPHRRSTVRVKMYMCIFVCCCTKAVHIEAVSDMTTQAFLATLERFISRRGLCRHIFSDRGTNFVGASNELRKMFKFLSSSPQREHIEGFVTDKGIAWHFQPPSAPHFGGLHEAAVKLAKHHVKRVIGSQILTYEELSTLFCRVEAVLNSRPLCSLSEDPAENDVLTPGHFLVGGPLVMLPESRANNGSSPRSRWRLVQQMNQVFWKRWSREYLHTLIQRSKWFQGADNNKIGALVLIQEDSLPPQEWKLARISGLTPGRDGVVRVVHLKTSMGNLTRPAVKVFPLPIH